MQAVQSDLARFKAYVELNEAKGLEYGQDDESDDTEDESRSNAREKATSGN